MSSAAAWVKPGTTRHPRWLHPPHTRPCRSTHPAALVVVVPASPLPSPSSLPSLRMDLPPAAQPPTCSGPCPTSPPLRTRPRRLSLRPYELSPSYDNVFHKFSVRYFLNLVLVDEEDRRYFKQQVRCGACTRCRPAPAPVGGEAGPWQVHAPLLAFRWERQPMCSRQLGCSERPLPPDVAATWQGAGPNAPRHSPALPSLLPCPLSMLCCAVSRSLSSAPRLVSLISGQTSLQCAPPPPLPAHRRSRCTG